MTEKICVFEVCGGKQNTNIKYQNIARVDVGGGMPRLVFIVHRSTLPTVKIEFCLLLYGIINSY